MVHLRRQLASAQMIVKCRRSRSEKGTMVHHEKEKGQHADIDVHIVFLFILKLYGSSPPIVSARIRFDSARKSLIESCYSKPMPVPYLSRESRHVAGRGGALDPPLEINGEFELS